MATTTTTISDDALQLIQKQARHFTILDLKKRALLEKQKGNTQHALSYFKQAKQIEQEDQAEQADDNDNDDAPSYSSTLSLFWKQVALLCKQAGDISKAKQALMHSKELEKQEQKNEIQNDAENTTATVIDDDVATPTPISTSTSTSTSAPTVTISKDAVPLPPPPPSYENIMNTTDIMMNLPPPPPLPPPPSYENIIPKNSTSTSNSTIEQRKQQQQQKNMERRKKLQEQEEIERKSSALSASSREDNRKAATTVTVTAPTSIATAATTNTTTTPTTTAAAAVAVDDSDDEVVDDVSDGNNNHDLGMMSFNDAEMMDEEMMTEFVELGEVESIPSQEQYAAKVLEYKKLALHWKQEGNIPQATQQLRTAKQLEKVAAVLKSMTTTSGTHDNNNEHGGDWMESFNSEEK